MYFSYKVSESASFQEGLSPAMKTKSHKILNVTRQFWCWM